jgi:hypothetical protein
MKKVWMFNPHAGGKKILPATQDAVRNRILAHAEKKYKGKYSRIDIKFRGALCYMDAYQEPQVGKKHPTAAFGKLVKNLSTDSGTRLPTFVAYDTLTSTGGASPSTPTATSGTNRARSRMASGLGHRNRPLILAPSIWNN